MQQNRDNIYCGLTKIFFNCQAHPDEIANMIIYNDQTEVRTIICSNCLALMPSQSKEVKPFKMALLQIHKTCKKLMTDVTLAAFVDHHLNLIRGIVRNHFKQIQPLLQSSVTNWFSKYRELINGKYFNEFYGAGSEILSIVNKNKNSQDHSVEKFKRLKRLMNFIDCFYKKITVLEDYQKMTLEQVMSGQNLLKKIKTEVGDIYKQFKEKAPTAKNWNQEEVLQIFNPSVETTKFYRFSQTLLHSTLKIVDPKVVTMPNLPESQYTVLSLIQPSIGNKKRSIKLRMNGIKAWVAVGIAIKSKVEANCYKFQSTNHGTFQISYDGYSWGQDSSVNEQYTSWYFNQNDILTLTVNPSAGELVFVKNDELTKPYTLKFKHQKKDKLYFCVSVNYHQDSVSIVE